MAGYANVVLGTGVAYFRYAYVNASGTRIPSSGYTVARGSVNVQCDHLYIDSITPSSGYDYPWRASYSNTSRFSSSTVYKYSGYDSSCGINIYPNSSATSSSPAKVTLSATQATTEYTYYYRVNLYVDGSRVDYYDGYATTESANGYNISISTARSYFTIQDNWEYSYASGGNACTFSNGYFTVTSTSNSSKSVCNLYYITKAGWARLSIGTGIASVSYAYVTVGGTRVPSSGYNTTTSSFTVQCDHLYINAVTYASGYTTPWNASYSGSFSGSSSKPTSGYGNVNANIYPSTSGTSSSSPATITLTGSLPTYTYYYRINLYVDGSLNNTYYGNSTVYSSSGTSISIASARSHFTLQSDWVAASPAADAGYACTFAQGYFTITSQDVNNPSVCNLYYNTVTYTYYYRVNLYVNGELKNYVNKSYNSKVSTGYNISLQTAKSYFTIQDNWAFESASAGANCTYAQGWFTITSQNSSDRSICNLYYTITSYTYYYRVRWFVDGTLKDYHDDSRTVDTGSGINISLSTARGYFTIDTNRYTFSYAEGGYMCTYAQGYFTITSQSSSARSICDIYYTTNTYTVRASTTAACSGMFSALYVNGTTGAKTVTYGGSATVSYQLNYGYEFVGWYADASFSTLLGTGATYTVSNVTSDTTIYARAKKRSYTVTATTTSAYSAMFKHLYVDGVVGSNSVEYGRPSTLSYQLNYGYEFVGWYSDSAFRNLLGTGETYTISSVTENTTIYAKAKKKVFTCAASKTGYDCCFTSVSVSKTSPEYNETVTFTANVKSGYVFRGWYDSNGNRVSTNTSYQKQITANTTLYARASVEWTYGNKDTATGLKLKYSGGYQISAEEWDRLQTYINQRRSSNYSYNYTASTGGYLTADLYNDTRAAIGTGSTVQKKQRISAVLLNALITNANNL